MALDFPNAPLVGQSFQNWFWDGMKWISGGGTSTGPNYLLTVGIDPKTLGAFGDGHGHPLSAVTGCQGQNTTGWTLAQWQVLFPFANALSNEIDQCAVLAACIQAAAGQTYVRISGGKFQFNFAPSVTIPGALTMIGAGPGITCFEVTTSTAVALPITVPQATANIGAVLTFKDFSVYSTLTTTLGGQGISITGSSGTPGRPFCVFDTVIIGQPEKSDNTAGILSKGVYLYCIDMSWFSNCTFAGAQNTIIGGPNNLSGIGLQSMGNGYTPPSSFYTFGPNMVDCYFVNLHRGIVIGDGTSIAYTQGVKISSSSWNFVNYGIVWRSNSTPANNDYLAVEQCDFNCPVISIWTDTVGTHLVNNNYFLQGNGTSMQIDNTGTGNTLGVISSNQFIGYGTTTGKGVIFSGTSGSQCAVYVSGNLFFDFLSGALPLQLGSGTVGITVAGNTFRDELGASRPSDLGTNNHWFNNSVVQSAAPQASTCWVTGVPTQDPYGMNTLSATAPFTAPVGGWSGFNMGAALQIGVGPGAANPAISMTDRTGANYLCVSNNGGNFYVAAMPALTNSTTNPTNLFSVGPTGPIGLSAPGGWTPLGTVPAVVNGQAPAGAHQTVQEWLTVLNASGTTRYIPAF